MSGVKKTARSQPPTVAKDGRITCPNCGAEWYDCTHLKNDVYKAIDRGVEMINALRLENERLKRFETYVCQVIAMGNQADLTVESLPR